MSIDILLPSYNGQRWISDTISSILSQSFCEFTLHISDDASTDNTIRIVNSFNDKRIHLIPNKKNVGYPGNLQRLFGYSHSDIIFLMSQDDILLPKALEKTITPLIKNPTIGAVTRPYYWFYQNRDQPVRYIHAPNKRNNIIIDVKSDTSYLQYLINSLGQLSGLAMRKSYITANVHKDIFTAHIYPFMSIVKNHPVLFLSDITVGVRIESSQTRSNQSVYSNSPLASWITMFNTLFDEPRYIHIHQQATAQMATHFVGLVQIKNYGTFNQLMREIWLHIKFRPQNIFHPSFWFYSILTLVAPKHILQKATDLYKKYVLPKKPDKEI